MDVRSEVTAAGDGLDLLGLFADAVWAAGTATSSDTASAANPSALERRCCAVRSVVRWGEHA
ncbi:hypothetical protein SCALM49S_03947 [Streptomyces californicus]